MEVTKDPTTADPIGGNELAKVIVPAVVNVIVFAPEVAFALRIAWRNEPAPLSFVFVTVKAPAASGALAEHMEK